MANEAVLQYEQEQPIPFTVANTTGVEMGTVMKLTDLMTAIKSTATSDPLAGIAAKEKIASDGNVKLACYRKGIFKMYLSGSCVVGNPLVAMDTTNHPNHVGVAPIASANSGAAIIGHALETGSTGETINVAVNIGAGAN